VQAVLEPSEGSGYTAFVTSLPMSLSKAETGEETLANFQKDIALYLEPIGAGCRSPNWSEACPPPLSHTGLTP
jgi:hypothetical protein